MLTFLTLIISLLSLLHANGSPEDNGAPQKGPVLQIAEPLVIGHPWKYFVFTNTGSYSNKRYEFTLSTIAYLEITDLFCKGDAFGIFDHSSLLATTPLVPVTCNSPTSDPDVAYPDASYSSWRVLLGSGNHNISIVVVNSPYSAGTGAIRLATAV